jgi:hypothetical protein
MNGSSLIPQLEVWAQGGQILESAAERTAEGGHFKVGQETLR